jgi:hypothetical protein
MSDFIAASDAPKASTMEAAIGQEISRVYFLTWLRYCEPAPEPDAYLARFVSCPFDGRPALNFFVLELHVIVDINVSLSYFVPQASDILLDIEAIPMDDQRLIRDQLTVLGSGPMTPVAGVDSLGQRTWLHAEGALDVSYTASVDLDRRPTAIAGLFAPPRPQLPTDFIPYLMPSRYCPSDQFSNFIARAFVRTDDGNVVLQMVDWIHQRIAYVSGSSGYATTAVDTFVSRQGVCRDFAHLLIALARAADIPARMVSAYALGLSPPDFHAVVEVYLAGQWHLIDPTRLVPEQNLVRIAVGRDATDIGFMTIFGSAEMIDQTVAVTATG